MNTHRRGSPVGGPGIQAFPYKNSLQGTLSATARVSPRNEAERAFPPKAGIAARSGISPLFLSLLLLPAGSVASASVAETEAQVLEPVVVVSTRSPRPVSEVVGMVTVLGDADIESQLVTNEEALWRYMPSVQVESAGSRFTARSLNIRGIGGNRVVMEVDGVPVQDRFAVGAFADAGRAGAEMDFIRRIELLRGPASSLYGSKAIGGVLAISTFDPDDLAFEDGRLAGRIRGSYASDWDAWGTSTVGAWQDGARGLLIGVSHRQGHEPDRSAHLPERDRIDRDRSAVLAKMTLGESPESRIRLTLDFDQDETVSEMNSLTGTGRFVNTTRLAGDDRATRSGIVLDGRAARGPFTTDVAVFHRETRTRQDTLDLRDAAPRPASIEREFSYDTTLSGVRGRVSREMERGAFRHRLMVGAEYERSERDQGRDATQTNLETGESTKLVLGERFPLRDFPRTTSHEAGIFLQDEIDSLSGRWTFIPSLRFDHTRVRVSDDAEWRQANPDAELAEVTESQLSPRLGVLWSPSREFQLWGQLASGFRAPPAEDLNIGLDIPMFRIRALPNPDLESESSLGWEFGVRAGSRGAWLSAAAFWTDYKDFIVSLVPLGLDPETGTLLFQSQNVERARIKGVEVEAGAPLGLVASRLDNFSAGFTGYLARGEDRRTGERLDDVGPLSTVLYLDWISNSGHWEARFSGLFARGKARDANDEQEWFRVPGHGVLDLTTAWHATDRLTLRAGLFNLADKTWWHWSEAGRLPADDPLIPALSAPGRSASVSFSLGLGAGRH
jgi:hemoglobin/transferrin/lactoferrin receptor protein